MSPFWRPFDVTGKAVLYNCKLSSDQRYLLFDCHESVSSSPANTPTTDNDKIVNSEEQKGKQGKVEESYCGNNVIRPVDLSKIMDLETHNAEKQGKHLVWKNVFSGVLKSSNETKCTNVEFFLQW